MNKKEVNEKINEILVKYDSLKDAFNSSEDLAYLLIMKGSYETCDLYNAGGISLEDAIDRGVVAIMDTICYWFNDDGIEYLRNQIRENLYVKRN